MNKQDAARDTLRATPLWNRREVQETDKFHGDWNYTLSPAASVPSAKSSIKSRAKL
jgi:hypothetical protein